MFSGVPSVVTVDHPSRFLLGRNRASLVLVLLLLIVLRLVTVFLGVQSLAKVAVQLFLVKYIRDVSK